MNINEKILVIMRKGNYSDSLIESLRKNNYVATQENTGAGGLRKIFDSNPSLIIIDTDLPDMSGYDVLAKKNSESLLARIPVFLISSNGESINMQSVPEGSVSEFILSLHDDITPIVSKIDKYLGNVQIAGAKANAKRILWVEDDKLIGTILSKKLMASGFELVCLRSGEEAMDYIVKDTRFDAVLLDLMLPGIGGFDILKKLKDSENTKDIPVMILSNLSKPSDIERAKTMGAQKFIVKAASSLDKIVDDTRALCK